MPKPRPLAPSEAKRTMVARMSRVADNVRQIATNLGARPYRVFLVWSFATGEERGEGTEVEKKRIEILPTPVVESLDAIQRGPFAGGAYPVGSIRLREVTLTLDASTLSGKRLPDGKVVDTLPEPWDFWYEVMEDGRHEVDPEPQKFRLLAPPVNDAENVQWILGLERVQQFGGHSPIPGQTPARVLPCADDE